VVTNGDGSKQVYPTTIEPVALTGEGNGFPITEFSTMLSQAGQPEADDCSDHSLKARLE
jgi:hypothetical protein